jgi:hypothetical protein
MGARTIPSEDDGAESKAIRLGSGEELVLGHDLPTEHTINVHTWLVSGDGAEWTKHVPATLTLLSFSSSFLSSSMEVGAPLVGEGLILMRMYAR